MMTNKIRSIGFLTPVGPPMGDRELEHFISTALYLPGDLIAYSINEQLTALFPEASIIETKDSDFNVET